MEERMKELEMGALVDLDEGHALFIVMGSTRKPYRVSLGAKSAARPIASTCQVRARGAVVRAPARVLRVLLVLRPCPASSWFSWVKSISDD